MSAVPSRQARADLKRRVAELPQRPGVYQFLDTAGAIIYIGKSVRLRDRVRSYFTGRAPTRKLSRLRREIAGLDWIETGSELEALLLESQLVKRHLPRYNTLLRDFRAAPYLRIDWHDPFPRLEVTRTVKADGAEYLGPFGSRGALAAAVDAIANAVQLRTCEGSGAGLPGTRPCYRLELGHCLGPCAGAAAEEYRAAMRSAADLFAARGDSPLRLLEEKMHAAADQLRFEAAARLRDALAAIRAASGRQQALLSAVRRLNLLAACPSRREDQVALFLFAAGRLVLQKEVAVAALREPAARTRLAAEVAAVQAAQPPPPADVTPETLPPAALDEIQIVSAWMRQRTREGVHLELPPGSDPGQRADQIGSWLADLGLRPPRSASAGPPGSGP
jgi:excinuclease UvrABC nuclease subunit